LAAALQRRLQRQQNSFQLTAHKRMTAKLLCMQQQAAALVTRFSLVR
jgi:hypothetical protein